MKLKLIQAGGFTGKHKIAEEDLSGYPKEFQTKVKNIFLHSSPSEIPQKESADISRDKPKYFIEYDGKSLPVNTIQPDKELEKLIEKMKANLHYYA